MTTQTFSDPYPFTHRNYQREIETLGNKLGWSDDLVIALRRLVRSTLNHQLPLPMVDLPTIMEAKEKLSNGISIGDTAYTIMVLVPQDVTASNQQKLFVLVPLYPDCKTLRLEEFPSTP